MISDQKILASARKTIDIESMVLRADAKIFWSEIIEF